MIGIENRDSSFFTIESSDVNLDNKEFEKNLISLSIMERTSGIPQGNLQFYDPEHWFSRKLRTGVTLKVSWGYKNRGTSPDSLLEKKLNFDEITGELVRRGLEGFVSSPTGEGGNNGVVKYNCKFSAWGFRGESSCKIYTNSTRKEVIEEAFRDLGINDYIVNFELGRESTGKGIIKDKSTFRFITQMAYEWRCLFHVGYNPMGQPVGIFVDRNKVGDSQYSSKFLGASGKSNVIGYMGELNNIKSYKWSSSESESGVGDNVMMDIVDGQIVFRRFSAEEEKVVTWKLNIEKVKKEYNSADTLQGQIQFVNDVMKTKTFEEVKHFFDKETQTTAPQGYGYRVTCDMIGNPLYMPTNEIILNNGFPDRILSNQGKENKFYIQSVSHDIDRSGYNMNVEIADVFTLSPIGQRL